MASRLARELDLTSADFRRRQKAREMAKDESQNFRSIKCSKQKELEEEKKKNMEMLLVYDPWGKPGAGAPTSQNNFTTNLINFSSNNFDRDNECFDGFLKFGQPGGGAPIRTSSGKLKVQLSGDPEIRFQTGQSVGLSVENGLRYKNENKEQYRLDLDNLIQQKKEMKQRELELEKTTAKEMENYYPYGRKRNRLYSRSKNGRRFSLDDEEFNPWGKGAGNPHRDDSGHVARNYSEGLPDVTLFDEEVGVVLPIHINRGGGGAPQRTESGSIKTRRGVVGANIKAQSDDIFGDNCYNPWGKPGGGAPQNWVKGKSFMERMGWSSNGDITKSSREYKQGYLDELQSDMERRKEGIKKEKLESQSFGDGYVPVLREREFLKGRRDPITGEYVSEPKSTSDFTTQRLDMRRARSHESLDYLKTLAQQSEDRQKAAFIEHQNEELKMKEHLETSDSFWGRPGNGAPRDTNRRFKLDSILYTPLPGEVTAS